MPNYILLETYDKLTILGLLLWDLKITLSSLRTASDFHTLEMSEWRSWKLIILCINCVCFLHSYHRNNMPEKVCVYNFSDSDTWMCNIFKLGDLLSR